LVEIIGFFGSLYTVVARALTGILNGLNGTLGGVANFMVALPAKVVGAIGSLGNVLYGAGQSLIQGLLNGAGSILGKIGQFFLEKLPAFIREPFKKALGIASPSKVFAGYGLNIVQGLTQGLGNSQGLLDHAMTKLSDGLTVSSSLNLGTTATASQALGAASSSAGPTYHIHLHQDGIVARSRSEWRDVIADGISAVNEDLVARGIAPIAGGKLNGSSTA
jgi:hypothetical protein